MIPKEKLAVCSWSLRPESCADLIAKLHDVGVKRTQLHLTPIARSEAGWHDAGKSFAAAGVELVSGMVGCVGEDYSSIDAIRRTGGVLPDDTWPRTRGAMAAAAKVAGNLGLTLVTFHAGFIPDRDEVEARQKIAGRLNDAADLFRDAGAAVALETGQESADVLLSLLEDTLKRDDIGVNFDPANMILYGSGDPIAALRHLLPHVRQVHLKDATPSVSPGKNWGTEVPFGEGGIDWPPFFDVLAGYTGDYCIEREGGDHRVAEVRRAIDRC